MNDLQILVGDCRETLKQLPDQSVQTCVTSPPYFGLRDYGHDGQIGLEQTPQDFVDQLVSVFREVKRVLRDDGTLWLNLGDSYCGTGDKGDYKDPKYAEGRNAQSKSITKKLNGFKSKDLIGIPWMVAFALRADGWYLRQDIIWHKPNPMPESVEDRCTKSHEYIFLMSKYPKYYYDNEAIKEPCKDDWGTRDRTNGKYHNEGSGLHPHAGLEKSYTKANKRSVWSVNTQSFRGAHFATFPEELIQPCILAGSRSSDVVLDPFGGSGTTGKVALEYGRKAILCELNPEYVEIIKQRTNVTAGFQF